MRLKTLKLIMILLGIHLRNTNGSESINSAAVGLVT